MRERFRQHKDLHLERMFETRSEAWTEVGLEVNVSARAARRAQREIAVLLPLLIGVLILYNFRTQILGKHTEGQWDTWIRWGTVLAMLTLGWGRWRSR